MSYTRPSTIIARILRQLGLKQGHDFRVRGEYRGRGADRERIGTYVAALTKEADQAVADHADEIERLSAEQGNSFRVSIHFTAAGRTLTWIANYGQRTRDAAPVATADKGQPALDTSSRRTAHQLGHRIVGGAQITPQRPATLEEATAAVAAFGQRFPKLKLGAARPAFEQPKAPAVPDLNAHPYEGLAQKPFGSLTWACEEAGQTWFFQNTRNSARYTLRVYRGRAHLVGWYLSGPGIGQPGSDRYMGATVTIAATAAQDVILEHAWITGRMEEAATQWPKGTRVQGVDSYGVTCMGTVNGVSWGVVTDPDHANYGRTWVDVTWDEYPHNRGTGRRNRPFTSDLIRH